MTIPRKTYISLLNNALEDRDTKRFLVYLTQMLFHARNYPEILENSKVSYRSAKAAMLGVEVLTKEDTMRMLGALDLELLATKGELDE